MLPKLFSYKTVKIKLIIYKLRRENTLANKIIHNSQIMNFTFSYAYFAKINCLKKWLIPLKCSYIVAQTQLSFSEKKTNNNAALNSAWHAFERYLFILIKQYFIHLSRINVSFFSLRLNHQLEIKKS